MFETHKKNPYKPKNVLLAKDWLKNRETSGFVVPKLVLVGFSGFHVIRFKVSLFIYVF